MASEKKAEQPIDPQVRIGHVHLKVADLERAIGFYRDVLGFELMQRMGDQAAFLSAGGYHHHIALNTWESLDGPPPPFGTTGLYHHAIVYPSRAALADALRRLIAAGIGLEGAADHGVSQSLYLRDPDGNGVELYVIGPERHGRTRRMESLPCTRDIWISGHCWRNCRRTRQMKFRRRKIYRYSECPERSRAAML